MSTATPESPRSMEHDQTPLLGDESDPALGVSSSVKPADSNRPAIPDQSALQDRLPEWFRTPPAFAGFSALLLLAFSFLSFRPLWHTDLWGHLAYGREIWNSGLSVLWGNEPLMPLSEGVPFVDTAWLSQLIGYLSYRALGVTALQFLYAFSITLCLGLLAWRFYRRTHSALVTGCGLALFAALAWQQIFVNSPNFLVPAAMMRPQLAGWVCFIGLFTCLTSRHWRPAYWGLIPALFALWANLHGSFLVGLLLLGCFCAGRAIDVERRTRRLGAIFKDRKIQRYLLLTELSALAVLLNPYGLQLYSAVLEISGHPNLQALVEWEPLTLRMNQGVAAAFAGVVLIFLYRLSPRRVTGTEVLLLAGFGGMTLYYSRFLVWWSPIAAYYLVLHGQAVLKQDRRRQPVLEPREHRSLWTVVSLGLLVIAFLATPFGLRVRFGTEADLHAALGNLTPIRAVDYLNQRAKDNELPQGLILNSYQWGDYLIWAGPRDFPVFVASHVHLIPDLIWNQYLDMVNLDVSSESLMDTHGINLIVLSKSMHERMIQRLQRDELWRQDYEDERAVIFTRRNPI